MARDATPIETRKGFPGDPDPTQSRYIEAAINGVLIGCLYTPNGNPRPGPKFDYKMAWISAFMAYAQTLIDADIPVILAGDYNVMPTEMDVYKPERWVKDALFAPEVRAAFADLLRQGWTDAIRALHPDEVVYTFWDYFRDAWGRNAGLRIDHLLVSPTLRNSIQAAGVDASVRGEEHPSDHAPAWVQIDV